MHGLYVTSVIVHILAAMLWVGGMGFFAIVVVPAVRRGLPPAQALDVLRQAGARFTTVGWICLGLLVLTGITNLHFRGVLPLLLTADFWRTPFGATLAAKLALVTLVLASTLAHARDARRASEVPAASVPHPERRTSALGRATFVLSLAVVALAVFLVRGAPW